MTTGELWITQPLFPWLMIVLASWVGFSTAVMARNWRRIRELEQCNKSLQETIIDATETFKAATEETDTNEECFLVPLASEDTERSESRSAEKAQC